MMNETQQKQVILTVPFSENWRTEWDKFIEHKAINATFLHYRKFYDHNPLNAKDDASLMFFKENRLVAVFPANLYQENNNIILHSYLRATYGGFIISNKVGLEAAIQIVDETIKYARQNNVQQIIVRNPFRIYHSNLCDETDYAMWLHGFRVSKREIETAVQLGGDIGTIRSYYHKGTKYSVGRARKNIKVRLSEDFKNFWVMLEKCLMERYGQKPVHDYASICRLRENVGEKNVLLFGAYYEDQLVGGNVVFKINNSVLHGQYNASDWNFQHFAPLHAVVDYIIGWGHERGFKYFNMGMSHENDGQAINKGLLHYKEGFGGRGLLRETMKFEIDNERPGTAF